MTFDSISDGTIVKKKLIKNLIQSMKATDYSELS